MGKLASSVAGPHPLPSRRAPYGPAAAVVIVGPITVSPGGGRATHNVALPAKEPGYAGLHHAIWELDGTLRTLSDKAWLTIPATGAKTARRPTIEKAGENAGVVAERLRVRPQGPTRGDVGDAARFNPAAVPEEEGGN